jgi:hypothetical protein
VHGLINGGPSQLMYQPLTEGLNSGKGAVNAA